MAQQIFYKLIHKVSCFYQRKSNKNNYNVGLQYEVGGVTFKIFHKFLRIKVHDKQSTLHSAQSHWKLSELKLKKMLKQGTDDISTPSSHSPETN